MKPDPDPDRFPYRCRTLLLAAALTLGACAHVPPRHEETFAPTAPEEASGATAGNGAIYQAAHDVPLFDNSVARHVGDVLTITLAENTQATKSATTTTKKTSAATLPGATLFGAPLTHNGTDILGAGVNHASAFDGEGNSAQSNQLTGNVSVTVARRLSNGNLVVRGEKWITLNQGQEYIRIQGIVRPVDIGPDNTVPSYKVADAHISYAGKGTLADSNAKSWLARLFDSPWMPF